MPLALSNSSCLFFELLRFKKNLAAVWLWHCSLTSLCEPLYCVCSPACCSDTQFAKLGISTQTTPWFPLFKDAFWQQDVTSVGLNHLFRIHPPVCLPYHICSSCTCSVGRGSWHVKTDVGRRADLPQCKASGLLKTLPNRAFVNCGEGGASEVIRAALSFERVSAICAFSLFLCCLHIMPSQANMQLHHELARGTDLAENSPSWKEEKKEKKKKIFQSAQISDLIYHTA